MLHNLPPRPAFSRLYYLLQLTAKVLASWCSPCNFLQISFFFEITKSKLTKKVYMDKVKINCFPQNRYMRNHLAESVARVTEPPNGWAGRLTFSSVSSRPFSTKLGVPHHALVPGAAPPQVQDLAFPSAEFLQPVWVPLNDSKACGVRTTLPSSVPSANVPCHCDHWWRCSTVLEPASTPGVRC